MMRGRKNTKIQNMRTGPMVIRCGHNYPMTECPYRYCAARALLEAAKTVDRQNMRTGLVGHDAMVTLRAAIRIAGERPEPEHIRNEQNTVR